MKKIQLISVTLILLVFSFTATAKPKDSTQNRLGAVVMKLSEEQWVSTKTAKVIVIANATLNEDNLASLRKSMLAKLMQVSNKGKWHVTAFNRTKTQSGLEQLYARAEARLSTNDLAGLRKKVKSISKPGMTFQVQGIQFTPTLADMQATKAALRVKLYQRIKTEVAELNKLYSTQKYFVFRVNFVDKTAPRPGLRAMSFARVAKSSSGSEAFAVSNKVTTTVMVMLATHVSSGN